MENMVSVGVEFDEAQTAADVHDTCLICLKLNYGHLMPCCSKVLPAELDVTFQETAEQTNVG